MMAIDVAIRADLQTFRAAQFWPSVEPWPRMVCQGKRGYILVLHNSECEPIQPGQWVVTTPSGRWYAIDQSLFELLFEPVCGDDEI